MAATLPSNIVVPEVWSPDVTIAREKASRLIRSGMLATSEQLQTEANAGGWTVNMPYMNPIAGASEVIDGSTALTVNNQTGQNVIAPRMFRGKAWGWADIVNWVRSPGEELADTAVRSIGEYWAEDTQTSVIQMLTGIFATTLAATHVSTVAATITAGAIIDAALKLGDARKRLAGLICHSKVAADLEKTDLVTALRNSEAEGGGFTLYMNQFEIIEDDDCPVNAGTPNTYDSYLFAAGSVGYAFADLDPAIAIESDRVALSSQSNIIARQNLCMGPVGVSYTGATTNPANTDLATGANWTKRYPDKLIGLVKLVTE